MRFDAASSYIMSWLILGLVIWAKLIIYIVILLDKYFIIPWNATPMPIVIIQLYPLDTDSELVVGI